MSTSQVLSFKVKVQKKKKKFFKKLQKNIQLGRVSFSHPIRGGGEKPKQIDFDARETVGS